jgi:hypothetical protein
VYEELKERFFGHKYRSAGEDEPEDEATVFRRIVARIFAV